MEEAILSGTLGQYFKLWEGGTISPTDWTGEACLYTDGEIRKPIGRDWDPWGDEASIRAYPAALRPT